MKYDAVILADGDFPQSAEALQVLRDAPYLVCCDNSGRKYLQWLEENLQHNNTISHPSTLPTPITQHPTPTTHHPYPMPDAIVGDGDSLPQKFKEKYAHLYHQVDEQEDNDLTKATRFVIKQLSTNTYHPTANTQKIAYLGTTGKREDHTLGNIFLLPRYKREFGIEPVIITDHGCFRPATGTHTFQSFPRQQVSIFNLTCQHITSDGLKWNSYPYEELWQGTLNEALTDTFTLHTDGSYLVFQTHKAK